MESPFAPPWSRRSPLRTRRRRHEGVARGVHARGRSARCGTGLRGDVIVAAVADEEVGSVGTEALVRRTTADAAIVTEPTEEVVAVAHKGFVAFEIETRGRAAHGSRPDLGIDAIAAMGPVLSRDRGARRAPARRRRTSAARHGLASRLADRGRAGVLELSGALPAQGGAAHDPGRDARARRGRAGGASRRHRCDRPAAVLTRALRDGRRAPVVAALQRHLGHDAVGGVAFWADSALLAAAGIPTVLFGPTSATSTAWTSGSTSPRSSAATTPTSPSRGSCARERIGPREPARASRCAPPSTGSPWETSTRSTGRSSRRERCAQLVVVDACRKPGLGAEAQAAASAPRRTSPGHERVVLGDPVDDLGGAAARRAPRRRPAARRPAGRPSVATSARRSIAARARLVDVQAPP